MGLISLVITLAVVLWLLSGFGLLDGFRGDEIGDFD